MIQGLQSAHCWICRRLNRRGALSKIVNGKLMLETNEEELYFLQNSYKFKRQYIFNYECKCAGIHK